MEDRWYDILKERMVVIMSREKKKAQKPKYNMWQNAWYMIVMAWKVKEKKVVVYAALLAILIVATNMLDTYITPIILGVVERKAPLSELLEIIAFFVLAMMFCNALSSYIRQNKFGQISVRTEIGNEINKKASTTSYPNMDDEKFLDALDAAFREVDSNNKSTERIWSTLTAFLKDFIGFIIYLCLLSNVNLLLIALVIVTGVIGYYVNRYLSEYEYRHKDEISHEHRKFWYSCNIVKDTAKDIRIFNIKPWLCEIADNALKAAVAIQRKGENIYIWGHILETFLALMRNGIAYFYLIGMIFYDKLTISEFLLYFSLVGSFNKWITGILNDAGELHKESLGICKVREVLEYPESFKFEDGKPLLVDRQRMYELKLFDVSYRYPKATKDTLSHVNITLHPGEKLAVVGLNGAGKTTLIKLMCGFIDPTEGAVLLDGVDIREYNRRDYFRMFSAVFQNFSLIPGSVALNVAQTVDDIDMERVKKCIKDAGLKDKIESLPSEYLTNLDRNVYDDATMLSGGETQKLMLARALYKDAPFIVLDEPTAALDAIAESEMYKKYNELTKDKSAIYISHRLASTRFCDRIIFIEDAGIKEEGTHDELLKRNGRYAELFLVQSKYYKEGANFNEE